MTSFCSGKERESAINLNKKVFNVIGGFSSIFKVGNRFAYVLVTDSPNPMPKTRKLCTGLLDGFEKFVTFAYFFSCHPLSFLSSL